MGDQSKMNQSAKDWCKVVVCATRWLGRVIHLIENRDKAVHIKLKYFKAEAIFWDFLASVQPIREIELEV